MDATRTSTLLLDALRAGDDPEAWIEFERRFRPLVLAVARRLGFGDADAEDVAQETCLAFLEDHRAGKYDPTRGRLGAWIAGIAHNRARARWRIVARDGGARGDSVLGTLPDDDVFEATWKTEADAHLVAEAFHALRRSSEVAEKTVLAFEATELDGRPAAEVASDLGLSVDSVYAARKRCMDRLTVLAAELREAYEI